MNYECCNDDICFFIDLKLKERGLTFPYSNNPKGRFLTQKGCSIPPQLRPLCTFHICPERELGPGNCHDKSKLQETKKVYFENLNELRAIRYLLKEDPSKVVSEFVI